MLLHMWCMYCDAARVLAGNELAAACTGCMGIDDAGVVCWCGNCVVAVFRWATCMCCS